MSEWLRATDEEASHFRAECEECDWTSDFTEDKGRADFQAQEHEDEHLTALLGECPKCGGRPHPGRKGSFYGSALDREGEE